MKACLFSIIAVLVSLTWSSSDKYDPQQDRGDLPLLREGSGPIIFVDADAAGENDGSSWADAFTDLERALQEAEARNEAGPVQIWAAAGTYRPSLRPEPADPRTATFHLPDNVALYGGFAGSEVSLHQRNPAAHETVLSGDLDGNDVIPARPDELWQDASRADNCYHLVTISGADPSTVLDGFTITGGKADSFEGQRSLGGGVFNVAGSPTLNGCLFIWNSAQQGGGMYNGQDCHPRLTNCAFQGNWGNDCGGGMYNSGAAPELVNCAFTGNMAADWGGGGMFNSYSAPLLVNCALTGNWASDGGSGMYNSTSSPVIVNSIIWGNIRDEIAFLQNAAITYSLIRGGWDDVGDIDGDPRFVDADGPDNLFGTRDDNVKLRPDSPCVNAGNNLVLPQDVTDLDGDGNSTEPIPSDLAGRPRIAEGTVDMGAYEYPGPSPVGEIRGTKFDDLNRDAQWTAGEFGLGGWTIYLVPEQDDGPPLTAVTDVTGRFAFRNLAAGTYVVSESVQAGWEQTFPQSAPREVQRVSLENDGAQANGFCERPSISGDGRYVAFRSGATNLVPGRTTSQQNIFVRDFREGVTELVSLSATGQEADANSFDPCISADGRFAAFWSFADNLVAGDTNNVADMFVRDRYADAMERVSVASNGAQANGESREPSLSADGRFVAFRSAASNLVPGDANGAWDIFVHDRQTHTTEWVSVGLFGVNANGDSFEPSISANGRYVAFFSGASNLVPDDTNARWDIFVFDRQTRQTERITLGHDGSQSNLSSHTPVISADGRYVAFASDASNLVPFDSNHSMDVFIHDRNAHSTRLVSVAPSGAQANGGSGQASISGDGRYVAFMSQANNLATGGSDSKWNVYVADRRTGAIECVNLATNGAMPDGESIYPAISADGRYVAFESPATNLVPGDTNGCIDVFARGTMAADGRYVIALAPGQIVEGANFGNHCRITLPNAARRFLPPDYAPAVPIVVVIAARPHAYSVVYAVEESPPPGWAVSEISDDGVWDAANGKVKWGPFFDHQPRNLVYKATPPEEAQGLQCFGPGAISLDGHSTVVCGDECVQPCPFHPADVNADRLLVMDEVTAYAACWKTGCTWPTPPNPIPIGYVTRAGALWRHGECYVCDFSQSLPLLWAECVPFDDLPPALNTPTGAVPAVRALQPLEGGSISVSLAVTPAPGAAAYALEETPPSGWASSQISDGGEFDPTSGHLRWGPFFDSHTRTLSYVISPLPAVPPNDAFAGTFSADGADTPVAGVQGVPALVPADFDCDRDVDREDLRHLQGCRTGPAVSRPANGCQDADLDNDGDVDQSDLGIFQRCYSGVNQMADPNCTN